MTTETEALRAQFELDFQIFDPSRNDVGDYTDRVVRVAWIAYQQGHAAAKAATAETSSCHCATCLPIGQKMRMVVCGICGNKRCPHATNHIFVCTGSNEPGQLGSSYGTPLYTADQLAAAVAAERERAAQFCDRRQAELLALVPGARRSNVVRMHEACANTAAVLAQAIRAGAKEPSDA